MKKITFLLMMLLSITAFSQVEIVENFDGEQPYGPLPTGWTATTDSNNNPQYYISDFDQCGGAGNSIATGVDRGAGEPAFPVETILTSPSYPAVTNDTDLTVSFSINVWERECPFCFPNIQTTAPVSDWGTVTLEYTVDGGANWITAVTINPADVPFVDTNSCTTIPATNLGPLAAGNDFQARFVTNMTNMKDGPDDWSLNIVIDNISLTQVATSAPNCDATLNSPAIGSNTADLNTSLSWSIATGLPTGYLVYVGSTPGGTDIVNGEATPNTNFSLDGYGLNYDTEYFVTIVPFNGIDFATGCTEVSFTTRTAPAEGATCLNPYVISSFPYVQAGDDTANYENNINVGPCGNFPDAYMTGYDVFYEITPTSDISIDITLAQITEFGAAIHVMEGCPDTATDCVAFIGHDYNSNPPYDLELQEVVLSAGTTYFIVLSSGNFNGTYSYSLLYIDQNSCINPSLTLSTSADCSNDQFFVDVDVTYLGTASSVTISDNFGESATGITSTGVVAGFGPYPSGTNVDFTVTNEQDDTCSYTDSIAYFCPPSNDDCVNNIALSVNTDDTCTLFTSAFNIGASESASNPINCEFTNTNDVWFSFVATSETIILEYLNVVAVLGDGALFQSTELLEGSCGSFTSLGCFASNYVTLNNLTIGNTYYIRNNTNWTGDYAQSYDICLKEAPAAPSNDECSNAIELFVSTDDNCNNLLSGTTTGATPSAENTCNSGFSANWKDVWYVFTASETGLYEFSFNRVGYNPSADYFLYSGACGALVEESEFCGSTSASVQSMTSGESRYIMVRSSDSGPGVDFDLCVFKLPPPVSNNDCATPTVLLASADANGDNMITGNFANSYPSPENCNSAKAIWYSFTATYTGMHTFNFTSTVGFPNYAIYNTDDCSQTTDNYVMNASCFTGQGDVVTDLVGGNTYLISVYSFDNFTNEEFELLVYPDPSLSVDTNNFESFTYYPNPVVNTLTVEAQNAISAVSVYNMIGQKVKSIEPNTVKSVIDMNELEDGVYFVTVTIESSQKTIKVIKK